MEGRNEDQVAMDSESSCPSWDELKMSYRKDLYYK